MPEFYTTIACKNMFPEILGSPSPTLINGSNKNARIALNGTLMTELRDVTCHVRSQCYLPPDTSERAPP